MTEAQKRSIKRQKILGQRKSIELKEKRMLAGKMQDFKNVLSRANQKNTKIDQVRGLMRELQQTTNSPTGDLLVDQGQWDKATG